MNTHLYKPKLRNRIFAYIIDLFVMLTLFTMVFSFIFTPLFAQLTNIKEYEDKVIQMRIDSHLYEKDNENIYVEISKNYDENITLFYKEFDYSDIEDDKIIDHLEKYEKAKEESDLFIYDESKGWIEKKDVNEKDLKSFYSVQWEKANDLFLQKKTLNSYSYRMIIVRVAVIVVSLIFTYLAYYLLVPLFTKDGQTLGKLVCGLKVVDQNGFKVKYSRMVLKCFVGLTFDLILAIFFGLTWFVSVGMMVFTTNNITIADYFSATFVVDGKESTMFANKEEMEQFEKDNKDHKFKYVHEKGY